MPLTLLIPAREDAERDAVAAAWVRRGGKVRRLDRYWAPPPFSEPASLRLYGPMTFCEFLAQRFRLELVSPPDNLLLHIDPRWLRREIRGLRLEDALHCPGPLFVKPVAPKAFRAAVYETADSLEQETAGLEPGTPVMVSHPVRFSYEIRCLALGGRIVSSGVYEGSAEEAERRNAVAFAQDFVSAHPTVETFALDVGWITGQGWAVIEANPVWGAGLNGCAADKMAECLERATRVP